MAFGQFLSKARDLEPHLKIQNFNKIGTDAQRTLHGRAAGCGGGLLAFVLLVVAHVSEQNRLTGPKNALKTLAVQLNTLGGNGGGDGSAARLVS